MKKLHLFHLLNFPDGHIMKLFLLYNVSFLSLTDSVSVNVICVSLFHSRQLM